MARLRLSLACCDYDRTRALADERVRPEGIELNFLALQPEETFFRAVRHHEFDVAEMSLSSFVLSLDHPVSEYAAIPVFPSRAFRHSGIYVASDGPPMSPSDLAGKRIGLSEYQLTANVWIRGILADHHDVPVDSVSYITAGLEDPRRLEKSKLDLPANISVEPAPAGKTLARMLVEGEIDAIYAPRAPSTLGEGGAERLFADFATAERSYFEKTRIFPIMHVIVIRRSVYERDPWVAGSLLKAFNQALEPALADLHDAAALKVSLPWMLSHAEETERLMGRSPWEYGLGDANRRVLETFLSYSFDQGLAKSQRTPESLFVPETLEAFAV